MGPVAKVTADIEKARLPGCTRSLRRRGASPRRRCVPRDQHQLRLGPAQLKLFHSAVWEAGKKMRDRDGTSRCVHGWFKAGWQAVMHGFQGCGFSMIWKGHVNARWIGDRLWVGDNHVETRVYFHGQRHTLTHTQTHTLILRD